MRRGAQAFRIVIPCRSGPALDCCRDELMKSLKDNGQRVQLELSVEVLHRLLRQHSLYACEVNFLNDSSFDAGRKALKSILVE